MYRITILVSKIPIVAIAAYSVKCINHQCTIFFMICFLKQQNSDELFTTENDMYFLHVLDDKHSIILSKLIICIYTLIEKCDKLILNIPSDMHSNEKLKVVLVKNLSPKISYMIS